MHTCLTGCQNLDWGWTGLALMLHAQPLFPLPSYYQPPSSSAHPVDGGLGVVDEHLRPLLLQLARGCLQLALLALRLQLLRAGACLASRAAAALDAQAPRLAAAAAAAAGPLVKPLGAAQRRGLGVALARPAVLALSLALAQLPALACRCAAV